MASLRERQKKLRTKTIKREAARFNSINEKYVLTEGLVKAIFPSQPLLEKGISVNMREKIGNYYIKFNAKKIRIREVLKFIESNWDNDWELRYAVAKLIGLLPKEIAIGYLPYLAVLSVDGNGYVSEAAKESWDTLKPDKSIEEWVKDIPREKLKRIEEFIEKNWNNKDNWRARYAVAKLIGLLPREVAMEYLPYLVVLSNDKQEDVKKVAKKSWNTLKPNESREEWIKGLDKDSKGMGIIKEFIEENGDNEDDRLRHSVAKLIGLLPKEIALEYLSYLVIIFACSDEHVKKEVYESWNKLKPDESIEEWIKGLDKDSKEVKIIRVFIEKSLDNENWALRYAVAKLIGLLPREVAMEYLSYLAVLSFNEPYLKILNFNYDEYVKEVAKESWNKLKPDESIEEWIMELDVNSEEMKIIRGFIEENLSKTNWRFKYTVAKLIGLLPGEIIIDYLPHLIILSFDLSKNVSKTAKESWEKLKPETWVNKMPREKLKRMEEFIEENWDNEDDWILRYVVAKLIGLLPREVAVEYLPYLVVLSNDKQEDVKKAAKKSWKKLMSSKGIKEWVRELNPKGREIKLIREHAKELLG